MKQENLWHDQAEDAIRAAVDACGGPKQVGSALWPSKRIADAARLLTHCLDPERPEKLALGEIELIGEMAAKENCHTIMTYLARRWNYADPRPLEPETELATLQREFLQAVEYQAALTKRMEQMMRLREVS